MPKISVIIPVYNTEKYLRECLDSVVNQTLEDIEIICVDDGSTDNSCGILNEYAAWDPRVQILHQKNQYAGAARNNGLSHAIGKYVIFLDSDDFFREDMLEKTYNKAEETEADVVLFDSMEYNTTTGEYAEHHRLNLKHIPDKPIFCAKDIPNKIFQVVSPVPWLKLIRRDFIQKEGLLFQSDLRCANDVFFGHSLLALAERITYIDDVFVYYRIGVQTNSVNAINTVKRYRTCILKALKAVYELLKSRGIYGELKQAFCDTAVSDIRCTLGRIQTDKARNTIYKEIAKTKWMKEIPEIYNRIVPQEYSLTFLEKIFSVKNLRNRNRVHKIIRICGIKLKFRNKAKEREIMAEEQRQNILYTKKQNEKILEHLKYTTTQLKKIMRERDFIQKHGINREQILYNIHNLKQSGGGGVVNENSDIIVSLTSYPGRMYDIHYSLYSLLTQTMKPKKVILWLSEEEFPNKEADLGKNVLDLQKNGLSIEWIKHNIKSYKKLIPALKKYPNNIIITADDDIYYSPDSIEKLYGTYINSGCKYIIANRCHKAEVNLDEFQPYEKWEKCIVSTEPSFSNFFTGAGMVLYPPNSLYGDVFKEEDFMELAPDADDVWFWAMALLKGTKILIPNESNKKLLYTNPYRELSLNGDTTLWATNKFTNDLFLDNISKKYPQIMDILNKEALSNEDIRQGVVI